MIYDADRNQLIIKLNTEQGLKLADLMLQTLFIYAVQTDQEVETIEHLKDMMHGRKVAVSMDFTDYFFEIDV